MYGFHKINSVNAGIRELMYIGLLSLSFLFLVDFRCLHDRGY